MNGTDITSSCTIDSNTLINAMVTSYGSFVVISSSTKQNVNGTSKTVITLPSGYEMKRTYFYAGSYGGTFVGEGVCQNRNVIMNILASSNNGSFSVTAPLVV